MEAIIAPRYAGMKDSMRSDIAPQATRLPLQSGECGRGPNDRFSHHRSGSRTIAMATDRSSEHSVGVTGAGQSRERPECALC